MSAHNPSFHKYHSYDNHRCEKTVQKIFETAPEGEIWDVTEKIHGAHYSFSIRGGKAESGKRSGFIKGEDFFAHETVKERYADAVLKAFEIVRSEHSPKMQQLVIHGELYGGVYPHKDVPSIPYVKLVQKGIFYTNTLQFCGYDMHDGKRYLDYDVCVDVFERCGIPFPRILFSGKFYDALAYDNVFVTDIPTRVFGHPPIEDNFAEGVVLKPRTSRYFIGGKRVMLKSKNPRFSEVKVKDKSKSKSKVPTEEELRQQQDAFDDVWEAMDDYVTENRLRNVESKGFQGNSRINPFVHDVLSEFLQEHNDQELVETYRNMKRDDRKFMAGKLEESVMRLIAETEAEEAGAEEN